MEHLDQPDNTKDQALPQDEEEKDSLAKSSNTKPAAYDVEQEIQFEKRPISQSHEKGFQWGSGSKHEPKDSSSPAKKSFYTMKATTDNTKIIENVKIIERQKSAEDIDFLTEKFTASRIFTQLNEGQIKLIVANAFFCEIDQGEHLFKQGDEGTCYFIIDSGKCEIIINGETKRVLGKGDRFGELALLYNAPRSASVRAVEDAKLWGLHRTEFKRAVEEIMSKQFEENKTFIENVAFFQQLTPDQRLAIAAELIYISFNKGENIVHEGDLTSSFYIIKEGTVTVMHEGTTIKKLGKGDYFGEQSFISENAVRAATVQASEKVSCLTLGRSQLVAILGDQIEKIIFKNMQRSAMFSSPYLKGLTSIQIEKVIDNMHVTKYPNDAIIFLKGSPCDKLVIVLEGTLKKKKTGAIVANKSQAYGETFLQKGNVNKTSDDDIILAAEAVGTLSEISFQKFTEILGIMLGSLENLLTKNRFSHENRMIHMESDLKRLAPKLDLQNFVYITVIREEHFSVVFIVYDKVLKKQLVLKVTPKRKITKDKAELKFINDRKIMDTLNFPFILQYIRTFKDDDYIYVATQYEQNLELFEVIRDIGLLQKYEAQFYTAAIILTVEYFHLNGVICRGIKPENFAIGLNGYPMFVDFAACKSLREKGSKINRTFTIVGTPQYMAPEMFTGKGYTLSSDVWSIGVILYEFVCGEVPFGEDSGDPFHIYEEMINKALKYPTWLKDKNMKRLIDQLLSKEPERRLGGSWGALKAHPWFDGIDWDMLLDQKLPPPYMIAEDDIIPESEFEEKIAKNIPVRIGVKEYFRDLKPYKKADSELPNWDKDF